MSEEKRMSIQVTFTEDEAPLYLWVMQKAKKTKSGKRWGVSRYIKQLIRADMFASGMGDELVVSQIVREISEERCPICGGRLRSQFIRQKANGKIHVSYYCPRCEMFHGKDIDPKEILKIKDLIKSIATIYDEHPGITEVIRRQKILEKINKISKAKEDLEKLLEYDRKSKS